MLKLNTGRRCGSSKLDVETKAAEVEGWLMSREKHLQDLVMFS